MRRLSLEQYNKPNENEGIIEIYINEEKYKFWIRANVVMNYIYEFLTQKFSDNIIFPEFNRIDYAILGENLPVEIQSTLVSKNKPSIAIFENIIRRQIEENINKYEKCWFFFDSEFYRYIKNGLRFGTALDMRWFVEFVRNGKLSVFTVSHNGIIEEKSLGDLKFLLKYTDCELMELDRNKMIIANKVLQGCGFGNREINKLYESFKLYKLSIKSDDYFVKWLEVGESSNKNMLLGNIIRSIGRVAAIDNALSLNVYIRGQIPLADWFYPSITLGLLYKNENDKVIFIDKFQISEHFHGYRKNKEFWEYLRNHQLNYGTFMNIVTGKISYKCVTDSLNYFEKFWQ